MNLFTLTLPLVAVSLFAFRAAPAATVGASAAPTASAEPLAPQGSGHGFAQGLRGDHGFTYDGSVIGVGPVASSGLINFDGRGSVAASFTTVVNGTAFEGSFVGTYAVNAAGLGSITIQLPWLGRQAHGRFVVVDGGHGTFFTCTDAGYSVTGTTRKT